MPVYLMQRGYALYTDIWRDQLPGLTELIRLAFAFLGPAVEPARAVVVILVTAGILGTALLGCEMGTPVGGLLAAGALALAPNVFWLSRAVISPDLPAISMGTFSLALAIIGLRNGRKALTVVAAVVFALGFLVKATAMLVLVPWGLAILLLSSAREGLSARIRNAFLFGGVATGAVAVVLSFYDWHALYAQMFVTQAQSGEVYDLKIVPHAIKIGQYLIADNEGILALGLAGTVVGIMRNRRGTFVVLGWLLATVAVLLVRSPMWPEHHLVVLLFPLAILAGFALQELWAGLGRWASAGMSSKGLTALSLLGAVVYAVSLPHILRADRQLVAAPTYESQLAVVEYLQQVSTADEFILTDYPLLAFHADRPVPPALSTLSGKRIEMGLLKDQEVIAAAEEYRVDVIVDWMGRLSRLPAFMDWVRGRYYLARTFGEDHRVYRRFDPATVRVSRPAKLGEKVELLGYTLDATEITAGQQVHLTLYVKTLQPMERMFKFFVHLVDDQDRVWGQVDEIAWGWFHPTTQWVPGEVVVQELSLPIAADATAGSYTVTMGMYDYETGKRLPVSENNQPLPHGRVPLCSLTVHGPTAGE